ncbi:neutral zinc metallopeptidase [uncultured Pigmentiphaga sp.]|uniref:KPN_02809 family neutral zinc metallopeptidase n=1 Tax=uncultured Pigmentiphaga sp. TaxID=340361 RepID=UPI00262EF7C9|nr:neutral zinc metallopeptidase [uncultured Pigmentiphaga sp.]
MRLDKGRQSRNVEDRRGAGPSLGGRGSLGIGAVILALVAMYFGIDPAVVLDLASGPGAPAEQTAGPPPADDPQAQFVSKVLADTEDTWGELFRASGSRYAEPKLVLYTGATGTACGMGQSAMGPFYCPADTRVYLDMSFFGEMQRRLNAPGDFARAYVIAHEIGHHVQNLLGTAERVSRQQRSVNTAEANRLSVRMELQADCYAGIWAHHANRSRQILEPGDVEEALNAASAIGDDRLQKEAQGYVVPDSFTHGTSEQRVRWFKRGLESGDPRQCDTFAAAAL